MPVPSPASILECWTDSERYLDIRSLRDFHRLFRRFGQCGQYLFRGVGDSTWNLETSLERAVIDAASTRDGLDDRRALYEKGLMSTRVPHRTFKPYDIELSLLREFQRHYHHFSTHLPLVDDKAEWYAMMQHHGAPTRWLDWTHAFGVAVFFAVHTSESRECAVYALHRRSLIGASMAAISHKRETLPSQIDEDKHFQNPELFTEVFESGDLTTVVPLNPYRLNQRLIIQQGHFLVPTNVRVSFEANLAAALKEMAKYAPSDSEIMASDKTPEKPLKKIVIHADPKLYREILRSLRSMNVSRATLFPGLDGFSQSLGNRLGAPDELIPISPNDAWK